MLCSEENYKNQHPLNAKTEEQTKQSPKEEGKRDKQRSSTKHTHKTKDRVTRNPLKIGMYSGAPRAY